MASKEIYFLNQVSNQKYNKDFAVSMVQLQNTVKSLSKYLIVMQQGIDDLNRDLVEVVRDLIEELIVIFNGGDLSALDFEWGDLYYVLKAIGAFFGFPSWSSGSAWTPAQMAQNFFDNFLSDFLEGISASFEELKHAFQGTYSGSDTALGVIQGIVNGLKGGLTGLIDFSRIPQLSLSQLTNQPGPNLLSGFGDFADAATMDSGGNWTWDASVGGGSARCDLNGSRKVLTSELVAVSEGQPLTISGLARKQSAVGSGNVAQLIVVPYIGDTAQAEVVIGGIGSGTNTTGTTVTGSWTVPVNVNGVRVRITGEAAGTSGQAWWDDVTLRKTATSLPQQWVNGLTTALDNLGDDISDALAWIKDLVEKLTGQARATIEDAIADALTFGDQLKTILTGGSVGSPLPNLPNLVQLGQSQITGLTSALNTVNQWLLNIVNGVIQAISKVPVFGGDLADRLEEMIGKVTEVKETADDGSIKSTNVGSQVEYVQQLVNVRSGAPFWETGPDPTGTVSFPWFLFNFPPHSVSMSGSGSPNLSIPPSSGSHTHSLTGAVGAASTGTAHTHSDNFAIPSGGAHGHTINGTISVSVSGSVSHKIDYCTVNPTSAPWALVRFGSTGPHKILGFLVRYTSAIDQMVCDIYRQEPDGSSTYIMSTADYADLLSSTFEFVLVTLPEDLQVQLGENYEVQFRIIGSGSAEVAAVEFYGASIPTFRPKAAGSWRDPGSDPTPASISIATRDAMYTTRCPFVSIGIDVGQATVLIPRTIFDDFNRSSLGYNWYSSGQIGIASNRVQHSGGFFDFGTAYMINARSLAGDRSYMECKMTSGSGEQLVGAGMHLSKSGQGLWITLEAGTLKIDTGTPSSRTNRVTLSGVESGRIKTVYEPSDKTYRVYKDGGETPITSFADTSDFVVRGNGRRFAGCIVYKGVGGNTGSVDDIIAEDIFL